MNVSCEEYDQVAVICVDGELSADTLEIFRTTITDNLQEDHNRLVINFEKVSFIDSQGLEALLWVKQQCEQNGGQVKLACLDDIATKILMMTRLDRQFDIHEQVIDAVRSFTQE